MPVNHLENGFEKTRSSPSVMEAEAIQRELSSLSDSDLCKELKSAGLSFGGISKSTRKFFEKRLAGHILKERGGCEGGVDSKEGADADQENTEVRDESRKNAGGRSTGEGSPSVQPCEKEQVQSRSAPAASSVPGGTYYVVCIPGEEGQENGGAERSATTRIIQNEKEVRKLMKENAEVRFKPFKSLEAAQNFAKLQTNLTTPKKKIDQPSKETQAASERANSYRTPKPQQLNGLRFVIEKQNAEKFKELVWSNPRFLVTSVDTPTFLHDGCKYNALHVATIKNLPEMLSLILDTLANPELAALLYPNDTQEAIASRWNFVTHLYLNSPEKGNSETPLHFASKFGYVECVQLLLEHPTCNKRVANKYGQTAYEIICARYKGDDRESVKSKITELLDDHFYVPVWRAEDDSVPAVVGEPWSPDVLESQSAVLSQQVKGSPIEASLFLRALAGPMSPSEAADFHRDWKTPPSSSKKRAAAVRRGDSEKGIERLGRDLAHTRKVPWLEYWLFLDDFVDLASAEGLEMLEQHLKDKYKNMIEISPDEIKTSITKESPPLAVSIMKNLASEFSTSSPPKHESGAGGVTERSGSKPEGGDAEVVGRDYGQGDSTRGSLVGQPQGIHLKGEGEDSRDPGIGGDACTAREKDEVGEINNPTQSNLKGSIDQGETNTGQSREIPPASSHETRTHHSENEGRVTPSGEDEVKDQALNSPPVSTDSSAVTPERDQGARNSTIGSSLFSPVQLVTSMMSRLFSTLRGYGSPENSDNTSRSSRDASEAATAQTGGSTSQEAAAEEERGGQGDDAGSDAGTPKTRSTDASNVRHGTSVEAKDDHASSEKSKESEQASTCHVSGEDHSTDLRKDNPLLHKDVPPSSVSSSSADAEPHRVNTGCYQCEEVGSSLPQEELMTKTNQQTAGETRHVITDPVITNSASDSARTNVVSAGENTSNQTDKSVSEEDTRVSQPKTPEDTTRGGAFFHTPVGQRIAATPSPTGKESSPVFINGETPSKLDLHVLRAIEGVTILDNFPYLKRWKQAVEGIPEERRQRWRTPVLMKRPGSNSGTTQTPSPSRHPSPLIGGRSPILQRLRHWSEPVGRGVGSQRGAQGMDLGQSPTGTGPRKGKAPRQNLMASAYVQ
ncbi:uncharacterized protein [Diadema setosum]|uniref:uncharacterized protein n=1 Tax=Diadema setosum TaxID=31175 RepID=UPI003B3A555A